MHTLRSSVPEATRQSCGREEEKVECNDQGVAFRYIDGPMLAMLQTFALQGGDMLRGSNIDMAASMV